MRLVTASQMKQIDQVAIKEMGIPSVSLMEAAGLNVVSAMERELGVLTGLNAVVCCGHGNNGGDGFVIARHLMNQGCRVNCWLLADESELSPDCAIQFRVCVEMGLAVHPLKQVQDMPVLVHMLAESDLVVDALLGTGINGPITGLMAALIVEMNRCGSYLVSVDVPSGLNADTGEVTGACAYAALTVTFAYIKRGLVVYPGRDFTGKLIVADIGIPAKAAEKQQWNTYWSEKAELAALIPQRNSCSHKKNSGSVFLLAGSLEYTGAAVLAARAAWRSGAGMVYVAAEKNTAEVVRRLIPECVVYQLDNVEGHVTANNLAQIRELLISADSVVMGPGLGANPQTLDLIRQLYVELKLPTVVDADALKVVCQADHVAENQNIVWTPHDGEVEAIWSDEEKLLDRTERVRSLAIRKSVQLVLKGAASRIATSRGDVFVNSSGNPLLAVAGTGDVLSGVIGSLMAQGLTGMDAARLGVFVHGLAADQFFEKQGGKGLLASDIIDALPEAFRVMAQPN